MQMPLGVPRSLDAEQFRLTWHSSSPMRLAVRIGDSATTGLPAGVGVASSDVGTTTYLVDLHAATVADGEPIRWEIADAGAGSARWVLEPLGAGTTFESPDFRPRVGSVELELSRSYDAWFARIPAATTIPGSDAPRPTGAPFVILDTSASMIRWYRNGSMALVLEALVSSARGGDPVRVVASPAVAGFGELTVRNREEIARAMQRLGAALEAGGYALGAPNPTVPGHATGSRVVVVTDSAATEVPANSDVRLCLLGAETVPAAAGSSVIAAGDPASGPGAIERLMHEFAG